MKKMEFESRKKIQIRKETNKTIDYTEKVDRGSMSRCACRDSASSPETLAWSREVGGASQDARSVFGCKSRVLTMNV